MANEAVMNRYRMVCSLGRGSFGTVVRAEDKITGSVVAIKLLHKDEDLNSDPQKEVRIYRKLLEGCRAQIELFPAVLGVGVHQGFSCIVFELCDSTLYDVIHGFCGLLPLPGRQLVEMVYQIVAAVEYLHSVGITHSDLKPDNIALKCADTTSIRWLDTITGYHNKKLLKSTEIRILDLGSAVCRNDGLTCSSGRIGNQCYRAPEISLGLPWSSGVDVFAIGCIVAELYLGRSLFPAESMTDREHLATVDKLVGPFGEEYARSVEKKIPGTFVFGDEVSVLFPASEVTLTAVEHAVPMKRLEDCKPLSGLVHDVVLHDLLHGLMRPSPSSRLGLDSALKHKYFDCLARLQWQ
ncbi:kinase-like protein [Cerioporus squamosus]|nr:kinase-like protein [Cerioporus squamosus]